MRKLRALFTPPPAPSDMPVQRLDDLLRDLTRLRAALPSTRGNDLDDGLRLTLNGYLFEEGPLLVHHLARALSDPQHFADLAATGRALEDELAQAERWLSLRELCRDLMECCDLQHRLRRGGMVQRAIALLRALGADAARQPQATLRAVLLGPARRVFDDWQHRLRGAPRA